MENITIGNIATILSIVVSIIGGIEFLALRMRKFIQKENDPIKKELQEQHKETLTKIGKLKEELDKNSLNTMKNTICNENIPLCERIDVFKEYVDKGGNGAVKIYGHQLEERYEKELKKEGN